jgi:hypothetical protein
LVATSVSSFGGVFNRFPHLVETLACFITPLQFGSRQHDGAQ